MNIWGEREETEQKVLLSSECGDNEDYSSDDGNEAKEDSTHEDHYAEEEDTLADSTSDVGDGDAEETEESRTQLGLHFKGRSVSRVRNFGLWSLYSSADTARVFRRHLLGWRWWPDR